MGLLLSYREYLKRDDPKDILRLSKERNSKRLQLKKETPREILLSISKAEPHGLPLPSSSREWLTCVWEQVTVGTAGAMSAYPVRWLHFGWNSVQTPTISSPELPVFMNRWKPSNRENGWLLISPHLTESFANTKCSWRIMKSTQKSNSHFAF